MNTWFESINRKQHRKKFVLVIVSLFTFAILTLNATRTTKGVSVPGMTYWAIFKLYL